MASVRNEGSFARAQVEQSPPSTFLPVGRNLEQRAHWALYCFLQRLRGRPVVAFIRQFQVWEKLDRASFERVQKARLADALAYARARVPLYSSRAWQTALSRGDPADILSWPVLDRRTVETQGRALLAQPAPGGLFFLSTSGSTGTPVHLALDSISRSWELAAMYRGWAWHGISPVARTLRLLGRFDTPFREALMNRKAISTVNLTVQRLESAARTVVSWQPTLVWGYASAAFQLARYISATRPAHLGHVLPYVLLTGEPLFPFQRRDIERSLGAHVIEGYGASDTAWIAMQCPRGSMHVNADHVHVEILWNGEPVPAGEFGDIVVTPVSNRAMPLVRYAVGDQGRLSPDPCPCGRPLPVLSELRGRTGDFLPDADGRPVHGSAITSGLDALFMDTAADGVRQILFEQVDRHAWRVLVETVQPMREAMAARAVDFVRRNFGAGCAVTVEPVPIIPREASGKFRYYRSRLIARRGERQPADVAKV